MKLFAGLIVVFLGVGCAFGRHEFVPSVSMEQKIDRQISSTVALKAAGRGTPVVQQTLKVVLDQSACGPSIGAYYNYVYCRVSLVNLNLRLPEGGRVVGIAKENTIRTEVSFSKEYNEYGKRIGDIDQITLVFEDAQGYEGVERYRSILSSKGVELLMTYQGPEIRD